MDREKTWRAIEQERLGLADIVKSLTDEQLNTASLCGEWRVRDVAAHVALLAQPSVWAFAIAAARAGGRFNKANQDMAVRHAESGVDLAGELRTYAGSRRLPRYTNYRNALFDVLVHGQDIAIPLGLERQMPIEAAAAGAETVWAMGFPFRTKRRFSDMRFVASDADWSAGCGIVVTGPIEAILLVLTGRAVALSRLAGPGHRELVQRLTPTRGA
ncbi:MAG: hypothetical protein QOH60_3866 [Mycobacterium sp.]|jgi:uncharacterized protein (TIGR03083 family)|nr:hypothetical protein [Mycobacterium sp.]